MHKIIFSAFFVFIFSVLIAQEKKLDTNTQSVKVHRERGYPISVLEVLPVVKGCEALTENKSYAAKCMEDQFNFLFVPFMDGIEKVTKANGVSVYIEFVIEKDATISGIQRLKVSDRTLDEFVRKSFVQFRRKIIQEDIILKPGRIYDRDVNTLYAVKFNKAFSNR